MSFVRSRKPYSVCWWLIIAVKVWHVVTSVLYLAQLQRANGYTTELQPLQPKQETCPQEPQLCHLALLLLQTMRYRFQICIMKSPRRTLSFVQFSWFINLVSNLVIHSFFPLQSIFGQIGTLIREPLLRVRRTIEFHLLERIKTNFATLLSPSHMYPFGLDWLFDANLVRP